MSLWIFNVHMDAVMKEVKMGRMGEILEEGRDYLAFFLQRTCFCVANRKKT